MRSPNMFASQVLVGLIGASKMQSDTELHAVLGKVYESGRFAGFSRHADFALEPGVTGRMGRACFKGEHAMYLG